MHAKAPYDPIKAHEYYLRTRHLKGRKKGTTTYDVATSSGKVEKLTAAELQKQKAYAAARVTAIQNKLTLLNQKLREKIAAEEKSKSKTPKKETAAEKAKKARESKQYREKHKTKLATKAKADSKKASSTTTKKSDTVDELTAKITTTRDNLLKEVQRQRALAAATKNG